MKEKQLSVKKSETLDLICGDLEIYQAKRGYRFGVETLLLAGFVETGHQQMVDLGCGSGIIPIVLVRFAKVKSAIGVEIQKNMVERARRSVAHNKLKDKIEIIQADIGKLDGVLPASRFDLVISNPPYLAARAGHQSKGRERAVARHEILATLADVVRSAARLLLPRAKFTLVFPTGRLPELLRLCNENKLRPARLRMIHGRVEMTSKHCLLESDSRVPIQRQNRDGLGKNPHLIFAQRHLVALPVLGQAGELVGALFETDGCIDAVYVTRVTRFVGPRILGIGEEGQLLRPFHRSATNIRHFFVVAVANGAGYGAVIGR
ncbi:MAG: tRNA (adenine(22)-N(1))-methyltransferase TrmK [Deltaproteobacteria bacterium]|nr:tRNA (adenine(22)-N(1))-methyltransferase TrmK [Deltaproteobacteria bacterium]